MHINGIQQDIPETEKKQDKVQQKKEEISLFWEND